MATDPRVDAYLEAVTDPARRDEARRLARIFGEATGWAPALWPGGVVGYGRYAYRYDSGHGGTSFATGFAVRARDFALHILPGYAEHPEIAGRLGPHRRGKACWYLRSLAKADEAALADLIRAGLADLCALWPVEPT